MAKRFCLETRELIAPVTALQFKDTKLYVGEGPYLSIYEITNGNRVAIKRVLEHQRIHCVKVSEVNSSSTIVVSGGKASSVVYSNPYTSELSIPKTALFPDWIWDVSLHQAPLTDTLLIALATGHNAVWLWDVEKDDKQKVSQCEEQCILYCACFIGQRLGSLWLASGTVFNEVLLWEVTLNQTNGGNTRVSKRLGGHDGVIFSVAFNEERQLLCSVSDDRSIKVWRLVDFLKPVQDVSNTEVAAEPLLVLYGHKARVWDCLILRNYIVSIGEDSTCLVWNSKGEIVKTFKGHIGKSIWSLAAAKDEKTIATGGGDGSVRLWSLDDADNTAQARHFSSPLPQDGAALQTPACKDIPRSLALLPNKNVLVLTDKGNFYIYKYCQKKDENSRVDSWELIRNEPEYCSYSVMALSACRTVVALGNIHGSIKLQSAVDSLWCPFEAKPYNDKVLSLHWIKIDESEELLNLFSCGPDGCIIWWSVSCLVEKKVFACDVKRRFRLPYCRQRWPNSIFVPPSHISSSGDQDVDTVSQLVVCGDRRGSLHIFNADDKEEPVDPLHSYLGIHGRNGVTHISCNRAFLFTAGRDGYFRQYKFRGTQLELVDKKKAYKGLEWIEQLNFTPDGDVLFLGFHTVDFVMWSMRRNEIVWRVRCGGGHRAWDILCPEPGERACTMFTYLKKLTVHVHKSRENRVRKPDILQESFHGREATCVCFVGSQESQCKGIPLRLLATGSEDTNINIMACILNTLVGTNSSFMSRAWELVVTTGGLQRRFTKLFTCQGHISSVRCLAVIKVKHPPSNEAPTYDFLLFSGGGRASLKCWSISLSNIASTNPKTSVKASESSHPLCTIMAELPNQVSRYRRKRMQRQVMEGSFSDIRFMSVSVFALSELVPDCCAMKTCTHLIGVISGCSDGYLRLYIMDGQVKTFTLISQFLWNEKCILCVGHFIHRSPSQPRLVVYAADTGGRIAFWDLTELVKEHFCNDLKCQTEDQGMVLEKSSDNDKRFLESKKDVDLSAVGTSSDSDSDSSEVCQPEQKDFLQKGCNFHPAVAHLGEDCEMVSEDCFHGDCEMASSGAGVGTKELNFCLDNEADSTNGCASHQKNCSDRFSEVDDSGEFFKRPFFCRSVHQSGVNAISVLRQGQDCGQYILCSGGDDGALTVASFKIRETSGRMDIHSWRSLSVPDAHTSSTTGVKIVDDLYALSVSVDQNLKLWKIVADEHCGISVALESSHFVDVADIQDVDMQRSRDGSYLIAVCGVGIQMLSLNISDRNE